MVKIKVTELCKLCRIDRRGNHYLWCHANPHRGESGHTEMTDDTYGTIIPVRHALTDPYLSGMMKKRFGKLVCCEGKLKCYACQAKVEKA